MLVVTPKSSPCRATSAGEKPYGVNAQNWRAVGAVPAYFETSPIPVGDSLQSFEYKPLRKIDLSRLSGHFGHHFTVGNSQQSIGISTHRRMERRPA